MSNTMQWAGDWDIDSDGAATRCFYWRDESWIIIAGGHEWPGGPPQNALKAIELLILLHGPNEYKIPSRDDYPENGQIEVTWLEDSKEEPLVPVPFWTARCEEWFAEEGEGWKTGSPPA